MENVTFVSHKLKETFTEPIFLIYAIPKRLTHI